MHFQSTIVAGLTLGLAALAQAQYAEPGSAGQLYRRSAFADPYDYSDLVARDANAYADFDEDMQLFARSADAYADADAFDADEHHLYARDALAEAAGVMNNMKTQLNKLKSALNVCKKGKSADEKKLKREGSQMNKLKGQVTTDKTMMNAVTR